MVAHTHHLRRRQAEHLHARRIANHAAHFAHLGRQAAGVVERGQPQGHQQQPAQGSAGGGQHQTLPKCGAVAPGAPARQGGPGQGAAQRRQQRGPLEYGLKARRQLGDVGGGFGRHAGLHRHPDHPDHDGPAGEEEQGEPVDQRRHAAPEGGQREGRQGRQRWECQQQGAVTGRGDQGGCDGHAGQQQGQAKVAINPQIQQLPAPAPERPQHQRPDGPGEPEEQVGGGAPLGPAGPHRGYPPAQQIQLPAHGHGDGQREQQHPDQALAHPGLSQREARREQGQQDDAAVEDGRCRCAGQGQPRQPDHQRHGSAVGPVIRRRQPQEHQHHAEQLNKGGRGFMRELRQPQRGHQRQQAAICQRAGVVDGVGLPPESEGHRLCIGLPRQVVHGVPRARQGGGQHGDERQAHGEVRRHPAGCQLDRPRAQPVGQQRAGIGHLAHQGGPKPLRQVGGAGQLQHVAEGGYVRVFPGRSAHIARHHVGHAEQQQCPARKASNGVLGNDGGVRLIQMNGKLRGLEAASNGRGANAPLVKKKGSAVARAALIRREKSGAAGF